MNAQQIASNQTFVQAALAEALHMISDKTGIAVESLAEQFATNKELQAACAKIVAGAAETMATTLNA